MRTFTTSLLLACLAIAVPAVQGAEPEEFELEPGFTLFFNGQDLTGWQIRGGESLAGKTEAPKKRIQVVDHKIVIDGKVKGNMVIDTIEPFKGDVHIKFQYLAKEGCNNDLYLRGVKFDIKQGGVKNLEFGKWNELEIIIQGDNLEIKNNGQSQRTASTKSDSSPLGLRAEFGDIEYRHLRYK